MKISKYLHYRFNIKYLLFNIKFLLKYSFNFLSILPICLVILSLLSIFIPKYLYSVITGYPSISVSSSIPFISIIPLLFLFTLIPFKFDHFSNILNILFSEFIPSTIISKSSVYANTSYSLLLNSIIKSLIYKSNNNDEIIFPCNTPLFTFIISESLDIFNFAYEYIYTKRPV